jgi:hypothetical protein
MRTRNGMPVEEDTDTDSISAGMYLVCGNCDQVILIHSPLVWQDTAELHMMTCC